MILYIPLFSYVVIYITTLLQRSSKSLPYHTMKFTGSHSYELYNSISIVQICLILLLKFCDELFTIDFQSINLCSLTILCGNLNINLICTGF